MKLVKQQRVKAANLPVGLKAINALTPTRKGVALALISSALFVFVGVLVRLLSDRIDPFQILLFRQIVFVVLLLPAISSNIDILLKPNKVRLHLLRISGALISLYFGYLTISNIPLADATALGFIQVLFVALTSRVFLSEQISLIRWFTIIVGFVGVMFIVQPSFKDASLVYILCGVVSAVGAAIAVTCVRKVSQTEPRITLLAYQAIFIGLISLVPSLFSWQWPTQNEWLLLLFVGIISSIAQWIGITAYKWADANVVANVEYSKIIYSILLGYWLFSEVPNACSLIGVIVLISSVMIPNQCRIKQGISKQ